MMALRALVAFCLALYLADAEKPIFQGQNGLPAAGCRCKGGGKDGDCGFHLGAGKEDEPWCRTEHKCGYQGSMFTGSWNYCSKSAVERRRADDGKFYNSYEFSKYYRDESKEQWKKAAPFSEKRYDKDNELYAIKDFRSYYIDTEGENGWVRKWEELAEYPEKKVDPASGKMLTFDEMWSRYGKAEVWKKWNSPNASGGEL